MQHKALLSSCTLEKLEDNSDDTLGRRVGLKRQRIQASRRVRQIVEAVPIRRYCERRDRIHVAHEMVHPASSFLRVNELSNAGGALGEMIMILAQV